MGQITGVASGIAPIVDVASTGSTGTTGKTGGPGFLDSLKSAIGNVNDAPTGAVTIGGTPTEDQILTADVSTLADADGLGTISYQWQRDGADIAGATGLTYTLGDADVGSTITVVASYTDGHGTVESVSSAAVGPVGNVNDAQKEAGRAVDALMTGDTQDIHRTMVALQQADVSFQLMMQVRNKLVTAYEEIQRMQI